MPTQKPIIVQDNTEYIPNIIQGKDIGENSLDAIAAILPFTTLSNMRRVQNARNVYNLGKYGYRNFRDPLDIKDPYTIMYYSGDYPADMCGNAVTNNNVAVFGDAPFGSNSLYFNGTNAYLQHSANANFLMQSDFMIDAYIKPIVPFYINRSV